MGSNRVTFGLLVLALLYWTAVILSWLFQDIPIHAASQPALYVDIGGRSYPVLLGQLTSSVPFLVAAILVLNLVSEFFGRGPTFALLLSGGLALPALWGMILLVETLIVPGKTGLDLSPVSLITLMNTTVIGFGFFSLIFDWFRKRTRGRFFYVRVVMAPLIGLHFVVVCLIASDAFPQFVLGKVLARYASEFVHWYILILLSLPVSLVVKPICRLVIGKDHTQKKMMQPSEKDFFGAREERLEKRISP